MGRLSKICFAMVVLAVFVGVSAAGLARQTTGKVMSVDGDRQQFVVTPTDGKNVKYTMDEDAQVYINNKEASLQDLRAGDRVSIVDRQDGDQWLAIEVRVDRK
jgi:Cu/Ag efflux protein CusF